jgi:hypothetical protein
MTLLTQYHDLSHRPVQRDHGVDRRHARISVPRETAMRGFFRATATILLGTAIFAGIVALKTAVYLPHFNY